MAATTAQAFAEPFVASGAAAAFRVLLSCSKSTLTWPVKRPESPRAQLPNFNKLISKMQPPCGDTAINNQHIRYQNTSLPKHQAQAKPPVYTQFGLGLCGSYYISLSRTFRSKGRSREFWFLLRKKELSHGPAMRAEKPLERNCPIHNSLVKLINKRNVPTGTLLLIGNSHVYI